MSTLIVFADESGNVNTSKDSGVYGIGYFATEKSSLNDFRDELYQNKLDSIHMTDLPFDEKKEVLKKFIEIAKKYPCFGGAWFHSDPSHASQDMTSIFDEYKSEFEENQAAEKDIKYAQRTKFLQQIYSGLLLSFFGHEKNSIYASKYSSIDLHIGIIGSKDQYLEMVLPFMKGIANAHLTNHNDFFRKGIFNSFEEVSISFDLEKSNPFLGAADIFAYLGRMKATDNSGFIPLKAIAAPILSRIENLPALMINT